MIRPDRAPGEMRPCSIEIDGPGTNERSVIIRVGKTEVLCSASVERGVPRFLRDGLGGWLTAEYSMLPSSTPRRKRRDRGSRVDGRDLEIQRLIGRSIRAALNLEALGERTFTLDCDVLRADGGTRTAAITGAYVALVRLLLTLQNRGELDGWPIRSPVAATSVGIVNSQTLLDLEYTEDSIAQVDLNVVMNDEGKFVEVQGTAEGHPFDRDIFDELLDLATRGIQDLLKLQQETIERFSS